MANAIGGHRPGRRRNGAGLQLDTIPQAEALAQAQAESVSARAGRGRSAGLSDNRGHRRSPPHPTSPATPRASAVKAVGTLELRFGHR
ncbi:MAG: hypothetical protein R3A10_05745 [Caldilineaceae bacterium]